MNAITSIPSPPSLTHTSESQESSKGSARVGEVLDLNRDWKVAVEQLGLQDRPISLEIAKIEGQVDVLARIEEECWVASRMVGQVDSYEVLQWVKQRVVNGHAEDEKKMMQLDELRKLRAKKSLLLCELLPIPKVAGSKPRLEMGAPREINWKRWWCVVIGISKYKEAENVLPGARRDGQAMYKFLTSTLGVPKENIVLLLDEDATRKKVVSSLRTHLLDNNRMTKGDKRLIYFAGHGSSYEAADYFKTRAGRTGSIEAICPVDRGIKDDGGKIIHDISDREINIFLQAVQRKWDSQTVVILDCCHSSGATRGMTNPKLLKVNTYARDIFARAILPVARALPGMLEAIEDEEERKIAMGEVWVADMTTHVLLAACKDHEQAAGLSRGGLFTQALLPGLESAASWQEELVVWKDILKKLGPIFNQTPVVLGLASRALWFEDDEGKVEHEMLPNVETCGSGGEEEEEQT